MRPVTEITKNFDFTRWFNEAEFVRIIDRHELERLPDNYVIYFEPLNGDQMNSPIDGVVDYDIDTDIEQGYGVDYAVFVQKNMQLPTIEREDDIAGIGFECERAVIREVGKLGLDNGIVDIDQLAVWLTIGEIERTGRRVIFAQLVLTHRLPRKPVYREGQAAIIAECIEKMELGGLRAYRVPFDEQAGLFASGQRHVRADAKYQREDHQQVSRAYF